MVHISQFYSCSEILVPCELYYVCELGKYLRMDYNQTLSLDGVKLAPEVVASKFYNYLKIAQTNNWVYTNEDLSDIDLNLIDFNSVHNFYLTESEVIFSKEEKEKRKKDPYYNLITPQSKQYFLSEAPFENVIYFKLRTSDRNESSVNNSTFNSVNADVIWLSFIAKQAVKRLMNNIDYRLVLEFDTQALLNSFAISYIKILKEEAPQTFDSWVICKYADDVSIESTYQYGYNAWYKKGLDLGFLNRTYTIIEKRDYLVHLDIKEGDFVIFYERKEGHKASPFKEISSCRMALVDKIDKRSISFTLINTAKVREQSKWDYDNLSMQLKQWYCNKLPYETMNTSKVTKDFIDLGIGYLMFTEVFFIVPLSEADEEVVQVVDVIHNKPVKLKLNQNELFYWILKSYGFKFNEARFKQKYFKKKVPLYDKYSMKMPIDEKYFIVD